MNQERDGTLPYLQCSPTAVPGKRKMSYEKPERIQLNQHDVFIALKTKEVLGELNRELRNIGFVITAIHYHKNEYCPERERGCTCPHWFMIKIENIHTRIYEPNIWFMICKRKRVYEIRWGHLGEDQTFVENDFWINSDNRTQQVGKYIHSYGLKQAASDIKIAHQAAEIKDYKSKEFEEYYAILFKKKAD